MVGPTRWRVLLCLLAPLCSTQALACPAPAQGPSLGPPTVSIPVVQPTPPRRITADDLARLRDLDALSVSPNGASFAFLVRQADPVANTYRMAWYVGQFDRDGLTYLGDGGQMRLLTHPNGMQTGDVDPGVARWSPDGRWIAYSRKCDNQVQVWASRADGGGQRQLTHHGSDVRDFAWSGDGQHVYFAVGMTRAEVSSREDAREREGHLLQTFRTLYSAVNPGLPQPLPETTWTHWVVDALGGEERLATQAEQAAFTAIRERQAGDPLEISAALRPPAIAGNGAVAWLERDDPTQTGTLPAGRVRAAAAPGAEPVVCEDPRCSGQVIRDLWWRGDASEVVFWSMDGPTDLRQSLYAWAPQSGQVRTIFSRADQVLNSCQVSQDRIVCLRETSLEPRHVAAIDITTGAVKKVADVNPEFANFRLGRAERIEWDSAPDVARMGYPPRAAGIVLYPPDYDPSRAYPLFVAPYSAGGFLRGDVGDEHPLLVYAANGFVVLNSAFPHAIRALVEGDANVIVQRAYDPQFGYPHLTMLADTTFAGIDAVVARANIDANRIGIGGVSHGAFVPLYMLQKRDRFAALSVAQGSWQDLEYFFAPLPFPYGEPPRNTFPVQDAFWEPIDLRRHLGEVEAPVLFHAAAGELLGMVRLIRSMSDARLPFEAFSFNDETHMKWQPAHRLAIYHRNLDWFRFWLQDLEDPDPAKADQYARWRELRTLQCGNPRALRNYCGGPAQ